MRYLLPLFFMACIQGTAEDTITKTTEINLSVPIPQQLQGLTGITLPPTTVSQSEPVDISNTLQQVEKIGTPSIAITQNHLHSNSGDFSFYQEIAVSIVPNDTTKAPVKLMDLMLTPQQQSGSDLDIPVLASGSDLLNVFGSGGTNLQFDLTVAGSPPSSGQLDVVSTLGMDVGLSVNKSINDIGK